MSLIQLCSTHIRIDKNVWMNSIVGINRNQVEMMIVSTATLTQALMAI